MSETPSEANDQELEQTAGGMYESSSMQLKMQAKLAKMNQAADAASSTLKSLADTERSIIKHP